MANYALDPKLEERLESIELDKALTHKRFCPTCIYNPTDSSQCKIEKYSFSLDHCINFTEQDTARKYLDKYCSICAVLKIKKCKFMKDLEWADRNKKNYEKLKKARFKRKRIILTVENLRFINDNCKVDHHHYKKMLGND